MSKFPTIFFGHGSPMNTIEENFYAKSWKEIVRDIKRPRAILMVSAHYDTIGTKITSNSTLKTIHDFYGFPQQLFDVKYSPSGDLKLALMRTTTNLTTNFLRLHFIKSSARTFATFRPEVYELQLGTESIGVIQEHNETI